MQHIHYSSTTLSGC